MVDLPDAVGADQDDVGGFAHELAGAQLVDGRPVDRVGQRQSKSREGLKVPRPEERRRRSSERCARSSCSQVMSRGSQSAWPISAQLASTPGRRSAGRVGEVHRLGGRHRRWARSVGRRCEKMRAARRRRAAAGVRAASRRWQRLSRAHRDGGSAPHGGQMRHASRAASRASLRAVIVALLTQQCERGRRSPNWPRAAACTKNAVGGTARSARSMRAVVAGGALVVDQLGDVSRILDLRAPVVTARVSGNDRGPLGDANALQGRRARRGCGARRCAAPSSRSGRSARRGSCRGAPRCAHAGRDWRAAPSRGRSSAKTSRDRRVRSSGHGRSAAMPAHQRGLGIQVVEIGERAGGEEAVADIANRSLHAALLIASGHRHRAWCEAVVRRQIEQRGVEADRLADSARARRCLQIVVEEDSVGTPPKAAKRRHGPPGSWPWRCRRRTAERSGASNRAPSRRPSADGVHGRSAGCRSEPSQLATTSPGSKRSRR